MRDSRRLLRMSASTADLLRGLYGCAPLYCMVGDTPWRFRWVPSTRPQAARRVAAMLQLRVGGADFVVGIDDAGPFRVLADSIRPELPPALRVACIAHAGTALWRALESVTRCAVELLDVQADAFMACGADCVGFELHALPGGPAVRGVVHAADEPARHLLRSASTSAMGRAPLPAGVCIRWAAVIGSTRLALSELRALQADDTVLIDDARCSPDALLCWLGAGRSRRPAGHVSLQQAGLQLIEFDCRGTTAMETTSTAAPAIHQAAGVDEIEVSLHFELARWQAPLAELAALAPGAVIDIGQGIDEPLVSVFVEQRCIGQGQLVAVGDRLGVRLLSMFGSEAAQAADAARRALQRTACAAELASSAASASAAATTANATDTAAEPALSAGAPSAKGNG